MEKNKEKIIAYQSNYRQANKDKMRAYNKKWRENNKAERKKYRENNKDKMRAYKKKYRENNRKEIRAYQKKYQENNKDKLQAKKNIYNKTYHKRPDVKEKANKRFKERLRTDINFRLANSLRCRLSNALNRNTKSASTLALLGCSVEQLKRHLEKQFQPGMTWEKKGTVFHIDHMIPCSLFDLSDAEQQRRCFHFTNLQPLFASENLTKGEKNIYGPYMKFENDEWHININGEYMSRSRQVEERIPTQYFYPIKWMLSKYNA